MSIWKYILFCCSGKGQKLKKKTRKEEIWRLQISLRLLKNKSEK